MSEYNLYSVSGIDYIVWTTYSMVVSRVYVMYSTLMYIVSHLSGIYPHLFIL